MSEADDDRYHRRPLRLDRLSANRSPFYFVTFNTYKRVPFLARAEIHDALRAFCARAHEQFGISTGRYVLMPDHIHLFVAFPQQGITLGNWIQSLKTVVGKELLRVGVQKPHWQEGFFDHVLRSGESYSMKWDYVRMNPVRAGLCTHADGWPYQGEVVSLRY